ncbi:AraC family transcriptional regulator [Dyadobacter beijingensis]|uniref:AraC family transcriptional regulator n=1 Tax=Dyadobacter beijingensis TaxID=365489 RepID=A0ABQ2HYX8_9BACT|nr:AraC family transcriptional regulator [Dyadobacter beijingensis]GGM95607.1 AraC family transcriptional regulator [Dyadobacter beijingensis]
MGYEANYIHPELKISAFTEHFHKSDVLFETHLLVWIISGETKIVQGGQTHRFGAGDTLFFPRHELVTVINYPKDGLRHQSVVMHLSDKRLGEYYAKHRVDVQRVARPSFRTFDKHPLLQSCLASLVPYFDLHEPLPEALAAIKIEEAMTILRTITPEIDHILADFGQPGKINLADFMEQHYMYNLPMTKFGYLTGRSLTTFKRDFKRTFQTTPQRWLTEKRLDLAHYLIREKKRRPSEVYLEVGFENLSHFGYAFKKQFGYPPNAGAK